MKNNVENRFRLNYLKSTETETPDIQLSISSYASEKESVPPLPPVAGDLPETFSSDVFLKQAKEDLKNPDPKVRILGIRYFLEKTYPSTPLALLQEILSDQDPEVRSEALRSLVKFRSPVIAPLLKKYLRDGDSKVRIAALRGMFRYPEKIDQNILLQLLSDESAWVRRKVVTLLGWTQLEGTLPILTEMSRDHDPMVRKAALYSLSILYPDEIEDRLMNAMTDPDPDLRAWAKMSLEKILERPLKRKKSLPNRV